MAGLLGWRTAVLEDRAELKTWECTEPGRNVRHGNRWVLDHPRPWERKVQGKIRTLEPPYRDSVFMLVGCDSDGIGAVIICEELDGPAQVEMCYGAVARRLRGKGGGYADEMIRHALDEITARAIEAETYTVEVTAQIHERNGPAQRMARESAGMRHTGQMADDSPYQVWSRVLVLEEPEES